MTRLRPLRFARLLAAAVLAAALAPARAWACACGCGVFDVSTSALLPTGPGGIVYLEYDSLNQNKDWAGARRGSDDNNADKRIRTDFFTAGVRYMFNRSWGIMTELPYWSRTLKTTDAGGNPAVFSHSAVGDIRVRAVYSGFSPDMSSGATFGLKLPTGDYSYPNFDPDTQIGTGSTDLLLGAYHMGRLPFAADWSWFANAQLDQPLLNAGGYRPGSEVAGVAGAYYDLWRDGRVKVSPVAQAIAVFRSRDMGTLALSEGSGYRRLLLSPGIEVSRGPLRVYGDVAFPVYQYVNGDQLVASQQFKLNVGYAF